MLGSRSTHIQNNNIQELTLNPYERVLQEDAKLQWWKLTKTETLVSSSQTFRCEATYRSGLVCFEVVEKSFGSGPVRLLFIRSRVGVLYFTHTSIV